MVEAAKYAFYQARLERNSKCLALVTCAEGLTILRNLEENHSNYPNKEFTSTERKIRQLVAYADSDATESEC